MTMNGFWNERYSEKEFVYGKHPNEFLKEELEKLPVGKILFPCEGEGRNAVFAAQIGWEVDAFDLSEEGFKKALLLSQERKASIRYVIEDAISIEYPANTFDVVSLIYAHFPSAIRQKVHRKITNWLKPGGKLILEAFNPNQLANNSGGPKDISMLYNNDMLLEDFKELKTELLFTTKIKLDEGKYHQGEADVIRYVGIKEKCL
jgi:SAM-dependent methyltransferase